MVQLKAAFLSLFALFPLGQALVLPEAQPAYSGFLSRQTRPDLNTWISTENGYAYDSILSNIGGANGNRPTQVPNVATGAVIASPSTAGPDYFYIWVRDGALSMKVIIEKYLQGDTSVNGLIENYVSLSKTLQQNNGGSDGEPKFNVDGSLFTGPWGRPQNDGPGLRASGLINYARARGLSDPYVTSNLYAPNNNSTGIKPDLEYVAHNWQNTCFDLWEEVNANHFYTMAVQRRALVEGATLAYDMNDPGAGAYYVQQANAITSAMQSFWNPSDNFVHAYMNDNTGRKGLDAAVLLASIHTYNQTSGQAGTDATTFQPGSDKILATHKAYVDSFRGLYSLNNGAGSTAAVAVGRYPEDVYNGDGTSQGNPWFLTTVAAAEVLYSALHSFASVGSLSVTSISQPFFAQFDSGVSVGTYSSSSSEYNTLTSGMKTMADGFMSIVETHSWVNGSLNEEFNRDTGFSQGARELTWSYASFLTAAASRAGTPIF